MELCQLTEGLKIIEGIGDRNRPVTDIAYDSRKCIPGSLFVCIKGMVTDGHRYIKDALERGARSLLTEDETPPGLMDKYNPAVIRVENTRDALAFISDRFFRHPSRDLSITGITGTKGKTTTAYMLKNIFDHGGYKMALSGSIQNIIGDEAENSIRTTPESYDINKFLGKARDRGIQKVVMEVSSQGLKLNRVKYLKFETGIFTNLYRDHIAPGEHRDMEDYLKSKIELFSMCSNSLVNLDNEYSKIVLDRINCENIYTFSIGERADFVAENITRSSHNIVFDFRSVFFNGKITCPIPGTFNVYNALAALGAALISGVSPRYLAQGLENVTVPGRAQAFKSVRGYTVIVDYAHTRDSLENILGTVREFTEGKLISVFGCGGNRDRNRRFEMGEVSGRIADFTIITTDNPRRENPRDIMEDIKGGIRRTGGKYILTEDRKEAIGHALSMAKEKDVVVIAGKGHETHQEFAHETIHFDDRQVVMEILMSEGRGEN